MLYGTSTGTLAALAAADTTALTSVRTSVFQSPNHLASDCAAILSISAASVGRVLRHASAVFCAWELVKTKRLASAIGLRSICGSAASVRTRSGAVAPSD